MTAAIGQSERESDFHTPPFTVRDLVLLRIAAGSATRADLQRDIAPILAPRISGSEFRRSAELAISTLGKRNSISESEGPSDRDGQRSSSCRDLSGIGADLRPSLGRRQKHALSSVRSKRTTRRIGQKGHAAPRRPRGDRVAAPFQQIDRPRPFARRSQSRTGDRRARKALSATRSRPGSARERGCPPSPAALLAGQLFKQPREIASDGKLIVQLASEIAGSREQSIEALELAVLRRLTSAEERQ